MIHAARVLACLDHPGVERFVTLDDDGHRTLLVTAFAGARSLADAPPRGPGELARTAAGILTGLAAIHRAGFIHGRIDADRIRLGPGGRPVLCDFRTAERPDPDVLDRARRNELASVGRLLLELIDTITVQPLRHPRTWWRLRTCERSARRLADAATGVRATVGDRDVPARRPAGTAPIRPSLHRPADRPTNRRRLLRYVAAAALAVTGVAMILTGVRGTSSPGTHTAADRPVPDATVEGTVVRAAGLTYRVGRPGDHVVLGDWDGDGVLTPAVLHPADGAVFVYRTWPAPDAPVVAAPVTRVPGATGLRVRSDPGGADILEATGPDGANAVRVDRPVSK